MLPAVITRPTDQQKQKSVPEQFQREDKKYRADEVQAQKDEENGAESVEDPFHDLLGNWEPITRKCILVQHDCKRLRNI